ncbi:hypothetical protein B296_00018451 [Ensete ventricosum]|uniref:Uncharacterized protein n=1 Tax=Ensete ventricosum TaxID=4639 RepID=A0A427B3W2_ENSVE|nr:hypothetical protein B296_00018451 [Ensete ventricosum]
MNCTLASRGTSSMLGGRCRSRELKMAGSNSDCTSSYRSGLCSVFGFSLSRRSPYVGLAGGAITGPFPFPLPAGDPSLLSTAPSSDIVRCQRLGRPMVREGISSRRPYQRRKFRLRDARVRVSSGRERSAFPLGGVTRALFYRRPNTGSYFHLPVHQQTLRGPILASWSGSRFGRIFDWFLSEGYRQFFFSLCHLRMVVDSFDLPMPGLMDDLFLFRWYYRAFCCRTVGSYCNLGELEP